MRFSRVLLLAIVSAVAVAVVPSFIPAGPSSSLDASGFLAQGRLLFAAGVIFLGGLFTSLTPCVYPLIPITVGVFGARKAESRLKATLLTSAYVVGMGLVFSILGVVAALSGKAFGSVLGNPWVVVGLAVFLLVLASSMFGAFEMALPTELNTKLSQIGGGGVVGALLMGSVAGFLAAPCTGPVLTGVLTWVSQTRDPLLGGLLLFIYALGIGVPFFLIGVFTVRLPKGGQWMEWVKSVFGIALVALAASNLRDAFPSVRKFMAPVVDTLGSMGLVGAAVALVFGGVLLGAVHLSFQRPLPKALGVVAVVLALVLRTSSAEAPTQPMSAEEAALAKSLHWQLHFRPDHDNSVDPFEVTLQKAKADCKPVMIDFFADWCAACKELDKLTYVEPSVAGESKRFVNVKVDGTNDHDVLTSLYARFKINGLPTVVFVSANGDVLDSPRVTGFLDAPAFLEQMKKVAPASCPTHL
jgi:thioredoxin:protein disulfide reductase